MHVCLMLLCVLLELLYIEFLFSTRRLHLNDPSSCNYDGVLNNMTRQWICVLACACMCLCLRIFELNSCIGTLCWTSYSCINSRTIPLCTWRPVCQCCSDGPSAHHSSEDKKCNMFRFVLHSFINGGIFTAYSNTLTSKTPAIYRQYSLMIKENLMSSIFSVWSLISSVFQTNIKSHQFSIMQTACLNHHTSCQVRWVVM